MRSNRCRNAARDYMGSKRAVLPLRRLIYDFDLERMETVSQGSARRKSRGADHSGHLRSSICIERCAALFWCGWQLGAGTGALAPWFQIMVRVARTARGART